MRALTLLLLTIPLLVAASGPVQSRAEPLDLAFARAQAEASVAESEERKLEQAAERAGSKAERLRAQQIAAAQGIATAEARISAADVQVRLTAARLAALHQRLDRERQPLTALLGGLMIMAQRPPLLAIASNASTDEMVRVRILLDSTLPMIRRRTSALAGELNRLRQLAAGMDASRDQLEAARTDLQQRQRAFAELEERALRSQETLSGKALAEGDAALSLAEEAERLSADVEEIRAVRPLVTDLALLGPAPLRPGTSATSRPPLPYRLPADAPVLEGFGTVNASGIRSRGITLATRRGSTVVAPATGIIRFAGPFRDYDGILIIDHGGGWMSLIINITSELKRGDRIAIGQPLGRTLAPIEIELSHNGRRLSPALIAGSSQSLSNGREDG